VAGPAQGQKGGDVAALGRSVFTTYLFPFEITAALLVIAVVGAVVLARRPDLGRAATDGEAEGGDADPGESGVTDPDAPEDLDAEVAGEPDVAVETGVQVEAGVQVESGVQVEAGVQVESGVQVEAGVQAEEVPR
jgi:hypothetical protein